MGGFFKNVWSMFTNSGMFSTAETIGILIASIILMVIVWCFIMNEENEKIRARMISDLGYEGYLRHKERMEKLGINVP